jgi:hypothetical protein
MAVWEIRPGDMDNRPVLVAGDKSDVAKGVFDFEGLPKDWAHRPPVELFSRMKAKSKLREPANVMAFTTGTFVLDAKARAAIGGFLSRFGQLLELHRSPGGSGAHGAGGAAESGEAAEILYAFNCTNLIECVDQERTRRDEFGAVIVEAFDMSRVPSAPAVFKDPSTASIRIYANDAAKEAIESWAEASTITGIEIVAVEPI